ncbi:MAG: chloride channel protein [Desulfatiglans sp.]|jgi:CIC family chloride channel protein|nr:chloride channel protein [Thermodesulfobacteriota bacterium]MEE4352103.1 chloride channel protein [Desulfatiglans sp.]
MDQTNGINRDSEQLALRMSRITTTGRWIFNYILIGFISGLGAILFQYLCQIGTHFFLDLLCGYRPPSPAGEGHLFPPSQTPFSRWMLLFMPSFGGILSGWLVYTFAPEAEGHGTDAAIEAYHDKGGYIRGRIPIIKTIASAITLTSGGSGGREGPIAQIGAGFGSFLATKLKLSERERRIMLAAGMGAGIGAIFRAPLAAALFAAEVLYREPEFESEVLIPAGISSVVAYCLFCLVFGWGSLFESSYFAFRNPLELGPYVMLVPVLIGAGVLYIKSFYGVHHIAKSTNIPNYLKPAIGGLCTGIVGFFLPQTLSFGYGYAQMALDNQIPILLLLSIAFGKILTTALSIGSGGSGGVFGPSIVIGGALGGAVGKIFHALIPQVVTQPGAFVVVGMAGFFAIVSNTPFSTIIFVSEMTNSYHLLLPSLMVCSLGYLLSRKWTIYEKQVKTKIDSNAHKGDFFVDVLATAKVRELLPHLHKVQLVPEDLPFVQFREVFRSSEQHYFPVINKEKKLTGIFSINDVRGFLFDREIDKVVIMKDLANNNIICTTPSEDLNEVLKKFTIRNLHRIPVVKDEDHTAFLGMLDRREVIQHYNQRVEEMKAHKGRGKARTETELVRLKEIQVREAMNCDPECIHEDMKMNDFKEIFFQRKYSSYPVVDNMGKLSGILSISDFLVAFEKNAFYLTAGEIATRDVISVTEDDSLFSALTRISSGNFAILPVIDLHDNKRLVGIISRGDIMIASGGKGVRLEK